MATTAIHVQGGPVVVNPQAAQQAQQQHQTRNLPTIKNLAITQLVIGVLCAVFGIAIRASLDDYLWATNTAAGLWAGGWILITGIIGIRSANNGVTNLNAVYLAFSIISTCASAISGLFFVLCIIHFSVQDDCYDHYYWRYRRCGNRNVGLGLFVPLLILMVIEFFISIIAAVYSCQRGCSGSTGGVIIQPAQPTVSVVTTGQGGTTYQFQQMAPTSYGVSVAQPYNQYPPPPNSSMPPQYPGQPMFVQAQPYQMPAQTNVVYSEKPPDYNASGQVPPHY